MQQGFHSPCNMYHGWEVSPLCCFGRHTQIHSVDVPLPLLCLGIIFWGSSADASRTGFIPASVIFLLLFCAAFFLLFLSPVPSPPKGNTEKKVRVTFHNEKYCKDCLIRLVIHFCVAYTRLHFASFLSTNSYLINKKYLFVHQDHQTVSERSHAYSRF